MIAAATTTMANHFVELTVARNISHSAIPERIEIQKSIGVPLGLNLLGLAFSQSELNETRSTAAECLSE
jgi:hypothetical protein